MDALVSKYEERMHNFAFQMAEKPIIVKKKKESIMSNREKYLFENSDKILSGKGFIFTKYKSDKERVNEYLKEQNLIKNFNQRTNVNSNKSQSKEYQIIQPSMRFKPRTDLERIYEVLKEREISEKDLKLVNKQMKKIGFITHRIPKRTFFNASNSNELEYEYGLSAIDKHKKHMENKLIEERRQMLKTNFNFEMLPKKKRVDNSEGRNLRSELYNKTHFKAMENLALFKTSTVNHSILREFSEEDILNQRKFLETKNNFFTTITNGFRTKASFYPRIQKKKNIQRICKTEENIGNKSRDNEDSERLNLIGNKKLIKDKEISKEIAKANPLLFNMNFNTTKNEEIAINATEDEINRLKRLAFEPTLEEEIPKDLKELNQGEAFDEYKKDEHIIIDGEEYKKTEINKIANKVLTKCNWNENKVKYQNKLGQGKLMFTNGLTISEFGMRYGIIP